MNKIAFLMVFLIFILLCRWGYAQEFSYVPRITLYGNVSKTIIADTVMSNPNDVPMELEAYYEGPHDFEFMDTNKDSINLSLKPRENRSVAFRITPLESGITESNLYFLIGGEASAVLYQLTITTNVEAEGGNAIQIAIVLISLIIITVIAYFIVRSGNWKKEADELGRIRERVGESKEKVF